MSGNVSGGNPPTNPSTMSRGNPTPPTTTMLAGIPHINPIPNMSGMGLRSNQSSRNPPWNASQVQGQYPWNGQFLGNYQPCWSPHPQGGNSPFNSIPQWNRQTLGNNQYFFGSSFSRRKSTLECK